MVDCLICNKLIFPIFDITVPIVGTKTELYECFHCSNKYNIIYEFKNNVMEMITFEGDNFNFNCVISNSNNITYYLFYESGKFVLEVKSNDYITDKDKIIFIEKTIKKIKKNIMFC